MRNYHHTRCPSEIKLGLNIFLKDVGEIGNYRRDCFPVIQPFPGRTVTPTNDLPDYEYCVGDLPGFADHVLTQVSETLN